MDKRGWTERLPKWLLNWMASLLPSQTSHGDNTVQVGEVNGELRIDKSQQAVTMVVTQNFYSAQVDSRPAANSRPSATTVNNEQREVLAVLRQLPDAAKERVFRHMVKKYGTKMVIQVEQAELKNLKRYMEVTLENERRKA